MNKTLGKIKKAEFGIKDNMFGLFLELSYEGCGAVWITGYNYNAKINIDELEDYLIKFHKVMIEIQKFLKDAKVNNVSQLVNVPIEVTEENGVVKDVRILTEVL